MPIPVGRPFDRVGVDVLQLPKTRSGKQYVTGFWKTVPNHTITEIHSIA